MGRIFNIERCSPSDGPGIRTVIFFKGCNLRCRWCHNPEAYLMNDSMEYIQSKCSSCGRCVAVCPEKQLKLTQNGITHAARERCLRTDCGFACVDSCFASARISVGKDISAEEAIAVVLRDKPYYKSGGGMTISGGEPLLQPDFALRLLELARENNINTACESALCVDFEIIKKIAPLVDCFMCDIKHLDDTMHREGTGTGNARILDNIKKLAAIHNDILIRIPLIPGYNDDDENLRRTADFIKSCGLTKIELLGYHSFGENKFLRLGLDYSLSGVESYSPQALKERCTYMKNLGLVVLNNE